MKFTKEPSEGLLWFDISNGWCSTLIYPDWRVLVNRLIHGSAVHPRPVLFKMISNEIRVRGYSFSVTRPSSCCCCNSLEIVSAFCWWYPGSLQCQSFAYVSMSALMFIQLKLSARLHRLLKRSPKKTLTDAKSLYVQIVKSPPFSSLKHHDTWDIAI